MTPLPPPPLLLVLRDLRGTSHRELLKACVRELVDRGVFRLAEREVQGWGRPRRELVLVDGQAPVLPAERLLAEVAGLVREAPALVGDGPVAREVTVVARHLGRQRGGRARVVGLALDELLAAGLVARDRRRLLGLVPLTTWTRTADGEHVLARAGVRRRRDDGGGSGDVGGTASAGGDDLDRAFDGPGTGSRFDEDFDGSFDSGSSGGDGGGGDGGGGGGGD